MVVGYHVNLSGRFLVIQRIFSDIDVYHRLFIHCDFDVMCSTLGICYCRCCIAIKVGAIVMLGPMTRNATLRHSDHIGERCGHITLSFIGGILGFLLAMITMNSGVRFLSL
jgi:hypothetical protein